MDSVIDSSKAKFANVRVELATRRRVSQVLATGDPVEIECELADTRQIRQVFRDLDMQLRVHRRLLSTDECPRSRSALQYVIKQQSIAIAILDGATARFESALSVGRPSGR